MDEHKLVTPTKRLVVIVKLVCFAFEGGAGDGSSSLSRNASTPSISGSPPPSRELLRTETGSMLIMLAAPAVHGR